ncbi:MAG: O-antigen ligase family protein, partial [candidate division Zixibacteria bacterium]|nr:O-antigen ligase family protein [candidate division Zixibacteria bacterium]
MSEPFKANKTGLAITSRHLLLSGLILLCVLVAVLACIVDPRYLLVAIGGMLVIFLMIKYDYFGLMVYLVVFLIRPGETYTVLNTIRLELVLGASLSFLTLLKNKFRYGQFTIPDSKLNTDFLLLLGAMFLSLAFSACKDCTTNSLMDMLKLGIFYLLIILQIDSKKRLEIFFWLFIIVNAKMAFDVTYGFYHGRAIFNQGLNRAKGINSTMDNFNGIAITMNTVIPFVYYLFLHYKAFWKKAIMGAILILFFWTLIITGSRGGLLGFLAILGFIWWQSRHKLVMAVALAFLLIAGWMNLGEDSRARYSSILDDNLDASSENRVKAWKDGLELFVTHPLTGVGAGAFAWARVERFGVYLNPHNLYIQVIAELGAIGTLIFAMFLIDIFRINRRIIKKVQVRGSPHARLEPFARATIIACLSLLVTGVFAHSAYRYTWYLLAALTVVSQQFARME